MHVTDISELTDEPMAPVSQQSSTQHHQHAYQALAYSLLDEPVLHRRLQLDSWLKQHGYGCQDGEIWEQVEHSIFWRDEYFAVIRELLKLGLFYSDATQKQLYHCYLESGRLTLEQQQVLHQKAVFLSSEQGPQKRKHHWLPLVGMLVCVSLLMPLMM